MGIIVRPELNPWTKPVFGSGYRLNPWHNLNQGLVAWWFFNENAGVDYWNALSVLLKATADAVTRKADKDGRYVEFVGYPMTVSAHLNLYPANPTLILRFKSTDKAHYSKIGGAFDNTNKRGYCIFTEQTSGKLYAQIGTGSATPYAISPADDCTGVAKWVALRYDHVNVSLFVEGRTKVSTAATANISYSSDDFTFGLTDTNAFAGNLYQAMLYNRPLSDKEIADVFLNPYGTPSYPRWLFPSSKHGIGTGVADLLGADWWPFFLRYHSES